MVPRSVTMMPEAPALRALSTTRSMEAGARNWPFFRCTGFPVRATASTSAVWRHRNAGTWIRSRTSAASSTSEVSCTSLVTGTPTDSRIFRSSRSPSRTPGPR